MGFKSLAVFSLSFTVFVYRLDVPLKALEALLIARS